MSGTSSNIHPTTTTSTVTSTRTPVVTPQSYTSLIPQLSRIIPHTHKDPHTKHSTIELATDSCEAIDTNAKTMDYVEKRMVEEAAKAPVSPEVQTIATPINFLLMSLLILISYYQLRPKPAVTLPQHPPATVFRTFTPLTLLPFSGENNMPVYLAVRGRVFDVSSGRKFYGPDGPYANFAGHDASRGLACGSFDEDMLTSDLEGPLDNLEGLGDEEMEALKGWEERFEEKYLVVGRLVRCGDEGKFEEKVEEKK